MNRLYYTLIRKRAVQALALLLAWPALLFAQDEKPLAPVTRTYAITNVNIIQGPGRKIDMGTVVIKNGLITAVGKGVAIPGEAIVIKADSMYIYAGFIDGLSRKGPGGTATHGVPVPTKPSELGNIGGVGLGLEIANKLMVGGLLRFP